MLLGPLVALASAPADATVNVSLLASGDFTPGSVITLNTYVTADAGEMDNTVFGRFLYPASQVDFANQGQQNALPGSGWVFASGRVAATVIR